MMRRDATEGKGDKHTASVAPEVAAGVAEGDKHVAADDAPPAVAVEERTPGRRIKMPQATVDWILSRTRRVFEQEDPDEYYNRMINDPDRDEVYTPEFLEEERHLMRNQALQFERSADRMERFQRWVRRELETKGCVEVDDVYLDQRIVYRERFKKLYDDMMRVPGFIYKYDEQIHGGGEGPVDADDRGQTGFKSS